MNIITAIILSLFSAQIFAKTVKYEAQSPRQHGHPER